MAIVVRGVSRAQIGGGFVTMTIHAMTFEEMGDVVERATTRIADLQEQIARLTAERDYATAVADALRFHNEQIERELGRVVRELVDARAALAAFPGRQT